MNSKYLYVTIVVSSIFFFFNSSIAAHGTGMMGWSGMHGYGYGYSWIWFVGSIVMHTGILTFSILGSIYFWKKIKK